MYLIMGTINLAPTLYLHRYASRLSALDRIRSSETLEQAVEAHKSFWKFVGIACLLVVGLYAVILVAGLTAALFMGSRW